MRMEGRVFSAYADNALAPQTLDFMRKHPTDVKLDYRYGLQFDGCIDDYAHSEEPMESFAGTC